MKREDLFRLAEKLDLEFKKNIATKKLLDMIAGKMNETIVLAEDEIGLVYCGKSPITGKEIWK